MHSTKGQLYWANVDDRSSNLRDLIWISVKIFTENDNAYLLEGASSQHQTRLSSLQRDLPRFSVAFGFVSRDVILHSEDSSSSSSLGSRTGASAMLPIEQSISQQKIEQRKHNIHSIQKKASLKLKKLINDDFFVVRLHWGDSSWRVNLDAAPHECF